MADSVREPAHATLDLRRRVLGRDVGGAHAVEAVRLRLELADRVELRRTSGADGIEVEVPTAEEPDDGPADACSRAARCFREEAGEDPDVAVRLHRRIPPGSGLGGAAGRAAAVLRGLSRLHGEPLAPEALRRLAAPLSADVPFALLDRPMALAWGRGQRLMPLDPPPPRPVLLLVPETRVAASDARRWLDEDRAEGGDAAEEDGAEHAAEEGRTAEPEGGAAEPSEQGTAGPGESDRPGAEPPPAAPAVLPRAPDLSRWDALLPVRGNDYENAVFARVPELAWWKEELLGEGAEAALLCGCGPAVCGVFADARHRDAAADRLRESGELAVLTTRGPV